MELFNEIDDFSDLFMIDRTAKFDTTLGEYQDLQTKYSNLHENYTKEIENSKKVEKCLVKCLKFYSKLCKKYEAQQKIIASLEGQLKEKVASLEESVKNEEKLKGLIEVYKCERNLYSGTTNESLKKDKAILLEICCKLICDSVKTNNTRSLANLILRKFKKDLDDYKLNLLKAKSVAVKKDSEFNFFEDLKPPTLLTFKSEKLNHLDENFWDSNTKEEKYCDTNCGSNTGKDEDGVCLSRNLLEGSYICLDLTSNPRNVSEKDGQETNVEQRNLQSKEDDCVLCDFPAIDEGGLEGTLLERESVVRIKETNVNGTCKITSQDSVKKGEIVAPVSAECQSDLNDKIQCDTQEKAISHVKGGSIFDIPSVAKGNDVSNQNNENIKCYGISVLNDTEISLFFTNSVDRTGDSLPRTDQDSNFDTTSGEETPTEDELRRIFNEMSHIRILSPIKELSETSPVRIKPCKSISGSLSLDLNGKIENVSDMLERQGRKRSRGLGDGCEKVKKMKTEGEEKLNVNCNLLDSILSAMSIQNKELKQNVINVPVEETASKLTAVSVKQAGYCKFGLGTKTYSRRLETGENESCLKENPPRRHANITHDKVVEKVVMDEIKSFVSSPMLTEEEANKNVKQCICVIGNKSEEIIARSIVTLILENVDEDVEVFERPAPPLTKTQHRLMVLLSVFRSLEPASENISNRIMSLLTETLFPDNFFWPDDCVETASRFFVALCKGRNDTKALWKFCLQAMTDMKQRSCLVVFTALKTWPDVLHDAYTLKNNILAVTIVNIFLHMPKTEGLRNLNQKKKLMALKHLLINFYQFKVDDTMETYAMKVLDSLLRGEVGSDKSLILLSKCREKSWTCKIIIPKLRGILQDWGEGKVETQVANRVLTVIKRITTSLKGEANEHGCQIEELISCLSGIVTTGEMSHLSEVQIVEVLLEMKHYPEARKVIREWVPKCPIGDDLRNEIVSVSSENILRELNRRKESSGKRKSLRKVCKKPSKTSKANKRGKKKGKKRKSNVTKARVPFTQGLHRTSVADFSS